MMMFKKYLVLALAGVFSAGAATADAIDDNKQGSNCSFVTGTVKLTLDPYCSIVAAYPWQAYLFLAGTQNTCFSVVVKGTLQGSGFSGLTTETLVSQIAGSAQTPAFMNEDGAPAINGVTRKVLTARSSLTVSGGTIRMADAIFDANGAVVEQVLFTGGDGAYKGATGTVLILSDSIGKWAPYVGQVCKAK
jgi:hypothetical protein